MKRKEQRKIRNKQVNRSADTYDEESDSNLTVRPKRSLARYTDYSNSNHRQQNDLLDMYEYLADSNENPLE